LKLWGSVAVIVLASMAWLALKSRTTDWFEVNRQDQPPVQILPEGDPALEAATTRARETVDGFLAELVGRSIPPSRAQVKVRIDEGNVIEHVWLVNLRYANGMIYGVLGNEPLQLEDWAPGDPAMVAPREITDWLLIEDSKILGGFTLRAARERLSPEQRERFDADFTAHFGVPPERFDDEG